MTTVLLTVLAALGAAAQAQSLHVIKFSEAIQFRQGTVTSNRIVHPDMGARAITLNLSVSEPGHEFAQHSHGGSDDTILVFEGGAFLRQGDSRRPMEAGECVFVPAGQVHGTITSKPGTVMISFQTPPDLLLYSGARDSSKPGAAPPKGEITPGALKYIRFADRNGEFLGPASGAASVRAGHHRLRAGQSFTIQSGGGAEHVLFVYKGAVALEQGGKRLAAAGRDSAFLRDAGSVLVRNAGKTDAVVIHAQSVPKASAAFDGSWVLRVPKPGVNKVYWLDVDSTGGGLRGRFYGATGGRMAALLEPALQGNDLRFRVERQMTDRVIGGPVALRLEGGRLRGTVGKAEVEGWRSPIILDRDDGSWKPQQPVTLFDAAMSGWDALRPDGKNDWKFSDGVLRNTVPKAAVLVSKQKFWNFRAHLEYRIPKGGNAGFGLRARYEMQIFDDYGQPPDVHGNGAIYSLIAPRVNASKPPGEWQSFDVTLVGREVTVLVNGVNVIDRKRIEGLCGVGSDPYEDQPGPFAIEGEHGPAEFRNLTVTPLAR